MSLLKGLEGPSHSRVGQEKGKQVSSIVYFFFYPLPDWEARNPRITQNSDMRVCHLEVCLASG